ncbi:Utp14-domain-containing protein [Mycena rebaudengoi]|nr:Utp14-domain-containing protein [Mycena rebaudengoi]
MARSGRPVASKNPQKPEAKAKANAAGYLKRQSSKKAPIRVEDVYELVDNDGGRRGKGKGKKPRKETLDLEYDWGEDGAGEGEQGDDPDADAREPRLMGEGDVIDSEDDEEIDSDAAFEDIDGDADGFAGVFGRKKVPSKKTNKRTVRFANVNLDEDEAMEDVADLGSDEEEDLDSDTFIDILDVLDGKGEVYNEDSDDDREPPKKPPIPLRSAPASDTKMDEDSGEESNDEDSGDESNSEEPDDEHLSSDEDLLADDHPDSLSALHSFISTLPSSAPSANKRKAPADADTDAPRKKRSLIAPALKERTQAGAEGEFQVGSSAQQKLSLTDLLAPLSADVSAVEKSLTGSTKAGKGKGKGKAGSGGGPLAAPLPLRTQARVDREAAYDATKGEVDKWNATMKRIREAEHLSFPLQGPKEQMGRVSNAELTAKFTPSTELETAVSRLLASANLAQDADIQRTENDLMAAVLSPEEVARRRNELRQMRELAFRGEVKARRVSKIKSKVYRKIARGKKERAERGEEVEDETEEGKMRREVDRAKERAGMRIKRNAKWNRARVDEEDGEEEFEGLGDRRDMELELERAERLTRLIRGEGDGGSDSDGDDSGEEGGEEGIKRAAFDELRNIGDEGEEGDDAAKQGGVFGMKFMQDAMRRRNLEAKQMADDFVQEMGLAEGSGDEGGDDDKPSGVIAQRTGGRVTYRPGAEVPSKTLPVAAGTSELTTKQHAPSPPPTQPARSRPLLSSASAAPAEPENPWLVGAESSSGGPKAPRAKNVVVVSKDSRVLDKARHKLAKNEKKLVSTAVAAARDDDIVEIELDHVLGGGLQKQKSSPKNNGGDDDDADDDEANSEVDAQEQALRLKGMMKGKGKAGKAAVMAFEQRDLVARAFAGDNVVRDFQDTKRREIASDAPKEVDTTLAGWGSWGGPSTRKTKPKPQFIKKVAGIAPTDRADHGKAHVIISEKRDKKAAKYQVNDLPYPFTSRAQFERRMEAPLGVEWNTRVGFQKGTLPRVVKKMGMVIEPLQKLS